MSKNLRWKALVILAVIALSVFAFYPPDQKVRLGLDLKGGVHLVMRVQTDDALRLETQTTADRLAEQLKTANIPVGAVAVADASSAAIWSRRRSISPRVTGSMFGSFRSFWIRVKAISRS